ncbi:MAG: LysM peptidoglycan-binding domain-containing protein [Candidatus Saccharimonas sp.]
MRVLTPVLVLAAISFASVYGGQAAYADDGSSNNSSNIKSGVVLARDPSVVDQSSDAAPAAKATTDSVVTVQKGDTLTQIAERFSVSVDDIVQLNSITNPDMINPGEELRIPADNSASSAGTTADYGQLLSAASRFIEPPKPVYAPTAVNYAAPANVSHGSYGSSAGNTYAWGQCTWYVKQRKPNLPNQLGNAGYNWLSGAQAAGFATGAEARPGAIGVQAGHVVIVEAVHGGLVDVSEMNYAGSVGIVHYRTVSASTFSYIYA